MPSSLFTLSLCRHKMKQRPKREWAYMTPHICKYCQRRFYNNLRRYRFHIKQHEKWIRPYWYSRQRITDDAIKISRHGETLTGINNLKACPVSPSDTSLPVSSAKNIPKKLHTTNNKPHQCKYGNKSFTHSSSKTIHERIHTKEKPYQCNYCNKSFTRANHKTRHERAHTTEKPYQCKYCNKSFTRSYGKTRHERVHTKEKPHQCK